MSNKSPNAMGRKELELAVTALRKAHGRQVNENYITRKEFSHYIADKRKIAHENECLKGAVDSLAYTIRKALDAIAPTPANAEVRALLQGAFEG